jgi:hypothetical protein
VVKSHLVQENKQKVCECTALQHVPQSVSLNLSSL